MLAVESRYRRTKNKGNLDEEKLSMTGSRRLKFVILQPPAGSIYKSGEYEASTRTDCPST